MGVRVVGNGGNSRWKHKAKPEIALTKTVRRGRTMVVLSVRRPGLRSGCDYLLVCSCL